LTDDPNSTPSMRAARDEDREGGEVVEDEEEDALA
jgi:hypothetical protein